MTTLTILCLALLILLAASLYASVGHGGASGYLAAMALLGVAPAVMKPTALALNILVATIATLKFSGAGCFSGSIFFPLAVASVPAAFIGGSIFLPSQIYRPIVGLVLLYAALRMLLIRQNLTSATISAIPLGWALLFGVSIGLLSGLTGVGGGIFLSPLLLSLGWANPRQAAGVSAPFILVNSIAGLLGQLSNVVNLPSVLPLWAIAAVVGGWIGSEYGSRRFKNTLLQQVLAVVLVIAGLKMIFT